MVLIKGLLDKKRKLVMKDRLTGIKIRSAEQRLIQCFALAESTSNPKLQKEWLDKAVEQEEIIKQLKGKE